MQYQKVFSFGNMKIFEEFNQFIAPLKAFFEFKFFIFFFFFFGTKRSCGKNQNQNQNQNHFELSYYNNEFWNSNQCFIIILFLFLDHPTELFTCSFFRWFEIKKKRDGQSNLQAVKLSTNQNHFFIKFSFFYFFKKKKRTSAFPGFSFLSCCTISQPITSWTSLYYIIHSQISHPQTHLAHYMDPINTKVTKLTDAEDWEAFLQAKYEHSNDKNLVWKKNFFYAPYFILFKFIWFLYFMKLFILFAYWMFIWFYLMVWIVWIVFIFKVLLISFFFLLFLVKNKAKIIFELLHVSYFIHKLLFDCIIYYLLFIRLD